MTRPKLATQTAKIAAKVSQADIAPRRRQTRAFAASVRAFAFEDGGAVKEEVEEEVEGDIEDLMGGDGDAVLGKRKRKRKQERGGGRLGIDTGTGIASSGDGAGAKVKKGKREPAKRIVNEAGEEEVRPPTNWEEVYDAVREMRREKVAPVDTMGCETLAEEHLTPRDKRFQTLIALMLSSQTKDTTNAIAMRRLQTELPSPGLTLANILAVDPTKLNELIYVVGFHNNKTRFIKAAAVILRDEHAGDIPDTVEGLMRLPGVGPKMAYLCLSAAWGRTEGIGVDVHVHRITNLWRWHRTNGPEETRKMLEAWLPRERWHEINHLLVGFGQTVCLPVGRKCGECRLSERGLCPSAVVQKKVVVKKAKREVVVKEEGGEGIQVEKIEEVVVKEEDKLADDVR